MSTPEPTENLRSLTVSTPPGVLTPGVPHRQGWLRNRRCDFSRRKRAVAVFFRVVRVVRGSTLPEPLLAGQIGCQFGGHSLGGEQADVDYLNHTIRPDQNRCREAVNAQTGQQI